MMSCSTSSQNKTTTVKENDERENFTKFQSRFGKEYWQKILDQEKKYLISEIALFENTQKVRFVFFNNPHLKEFKIYSLSTKSYGEFDPAAAQMHFTQFAGDKIHFQHEVFDSNQFLWKSFNEIRENLSIDRSDKVQLIKELTEDRDNIHIIVGDNVLGQFKDAIENLNRVEEFFWETQPKSTTYNPGKGQFDLKGENSLFWATMISPESKINSKAYIQYKYLFTVLFAGKSSYLYKDFVDGKRKYFLNLEQGELSLGRNNIFFVSGNLQSKSKLNSLKNHIAKNAFEICDESITSRHYLRGMNQLGIELLKTIKNESYWKRKVYSILTAGSVKNYIETYENMFSLSMDELRPVCSQFLTAAEPLIYTLWKKNK